MFEGGETMKNIKFVEVETLSLPFWDHAILGVVGAGVGYGIYGVIVVT